MPSAKWLSSLVLVGLCACSSGTSTLGSGGERGQELGTSGNSDGTHTESSETDDETVPGPSPGEPEPGNAAHATTDDRDPPPAEMSNSDTTSPLTAEDDGSTTPATAEASSASDVASTEVASADPDGVTPGTDVLAPSEPTPNATDPAAPSPEDPGAPPVDDEDPYAARTGPFKMLAYSKTNGFRHQDSIDSGKRMLTELAAQYDFEVTLTESNDEITPEGLSQHEILFFLNPTGDVFNNEEQRIFEEWMTQGGAFVGTHSATDTENGWAFYSEVTGQYYDLHDACCAEANIQWDPSALTFPGVQALPSPWRRAEEWYNFNSAADWSTKPGFRILSRVTTNGSTRPVSYIREWGNFRAFYTSLGHEGPTFDDENVRKHIAGGILWAVRREAMFTAM